MRCACIVSDGSGGSRFADLDVELTRSVPVAGLPPLLSSDAWPATGMILMHVPESDTGAPFPWHPAPDPRLIICLAGSSRQETTDGESRTFGPGEMFLTLDTEGKGHRSSNSGATSYVIVLLDRDPSRPGTGVPGTLPEER